MAKSTRPITYIYEFDGHTIEVTRRHAGTAYARNGNVSNPTEYFTWSVWANGEYAGRFGTRAAAYEHGRAHALDFFYDDRPGHEQNVRPFWVVRDEMRANYRGRTVEAAVA